MTTVTRALLKSLLIAGLGFILALHVASCGKKTDEELARLSEANTSLERERQDAQYKIRSLQKDLQTLETKGQVKLVEERRKYSEVIKDLCKDNENEEYRIRELKQTTYEQQSELDKLRRNSEIGSHQFRDNYCRLLAKVYTVYMVDVIAEMLEWGKKQDYKRPDDGRDFDWLKYRGFPSEFKLE